MTPTTLAPALTTPQALRIADAALAKARADQVRPMAVVVVDAAGQTKVCIREDGASALRVDIATGKASAAAGMGANGRQLAERAQKNPSFFTSISATARQPFIPQLGAVLIRDAAGQLLGAVGASGDTGEQDEAICIAGVVAAGFQAA